MATAVRAATGRRVTILLGRGRYVSDIPAHLLNPEDWSAAQDVLTSSGEAEQRKGWTFDGSVADVAANLQAVYRVAFKLANVTRMVSMTVAGFYIHNPAGAGTLTGGAATPPLCVYNDELLLSSPSNAGMVRYSGASGLGIVPSNTITFTANEATVTTAGSGAGTTAGMFMRVDSTANRLGGAYRISEVSSNTSWTLEGVRATNTQTIGGPNYMTSFGPPFPAVSVYDAGTVSISAGTVTGYGTRWASGSIASSFTHLMFNDAGTWRVIETPAGVSNTSLTTSYTGSATKVAYRLLAPLPFHTAVSHKGSLFGVTHFDPNRVWFGPPGWKIAFPPGAVLPYDPTVYPTSTNPSYFLMDYADVPAPDDTDPIVALLSAGDSLRILKRKSVHGMYGSHPSLTQGVIAHGIGCIDARSAIATDEGLFWCGETGAFWDDGEKITDLTAGKMNLEWRTLTAAWDANSYVTMGVAAGILVISGKFGSTSRTYLYDLHRKEWLGQMSNICARYQFSSRISGEREALYAVDDSQQGRIINLAPALNGTGITKDAGGTGPRLQILTSYRLHGDPIQESRCLDIEVSGTVYDPGTPASTKVALTYRTGGGALTGGEQLDKSLGTIDSDDTDRAFRTEFDAVNRSGRIHALFFDANTLGTNDATVKVRLAEATLTYRDRRSRT